jgi:hypothetical protein
MPESCSNDPPTRSKVLQRSSDNPALYSEKYAMNKLNTTTDALTVRNHSENSGNRSEHFGKRSEEFTGCSEHVEGHSKNIQPGRYTIQAIFSPVSGGFIRLRTPVLFFNKRLVFLKPENQKTMNNHWIEPLKIENQSENDFSRKVGLHTQISGISQPDNREITQLVGLHIR